MSAVLAVTPPPAGMAVIAAANRRARTELLAELAALDARFAPAPPPAAELRAILERLHDHPPPEVPPEARRLAALRGSASESARFRRTPLPAQADDFRARILEAAEDLAREAELAAALQTTAIGALHDADPDKISDLLRRPAVPAEPRPPAPAKSVQGGDENADPGGHDGTRHYKRSGQPPVALPPVKSQPTPTGTPTPIGPPTPTGTDAQNFADVDGLVQGSAAFSAPATATLKESFAVYLRVSPEKLAALMGRLKAEVPPSSTVVGRPDVRLAPRMWARVSGYGFDIDPKEQAFQAVSMHEPTTWVWQVTPTVAGDHSLLFELDGELEVSGKETPRRFYSAVQPVHIPVSVVDVLSDKWEWIASTLVIPLLLWIGRTVQLRRRPAKVARAAKPDQAAKSTPRRRAVGE